MRLDGVEIWKTTGFTNHAILPVLWVDISSVPEAANAILPLFWLQS